MIFFCGNTIKEQAESSVVSGTVASVVTWQREGRYLRGRDVRRIPLVGDWLADHVPRWRDDSPRRRAGSAAAARRAKVLWCSFPRQHSPLQCKPLHNASGDLLSECFKIGTQFQKYGYQFKAFGYQVKAQEAYPAVRRRLRDARDTIPH